MSEDMFDIAIVRKCSREPEAAALALLDQEGKRDAWRSTGLLGVKLALSQVQELVRLLQDARGAALVLPCRYAQPTISMQEARATAERRLDELKRLRGDVLGPLEDGHEQWMWWRFYSEHLPSQLEGREPGCVFIDIDKLDGHVADERDRGEYARWQMSR